jgi:hypothetical protein
VRERSQLQFLGTPTRGPAAQGLLELGETVQFILLVRARQVCAARLVRQAPPQLLALLHGLDLRTGPMFPRCFCFLQSGFLLRESCLQQPGGWVGFAAAPDLLRESRPFAT